MSDCLGKATGVVKDVVNVGGTSRAEGAGALGGKRYWRSINDYADTAEFRAWAAREFPAVSMELDRDGEADGTTRRRFLKLMGASLALAGLGLSGAGCRRKESKVLAYDKKTSEQIPGKALYYATTMVLAGRAIGLLAETHEGRPTKLEGNPLHPSSGGATHTFAQASVLELYDPDRSRVVTHDGRPARWAEDFLTFLDGHRAEIEKDGGRGLAVLAEDYASPALEMLREKMGRKLPKATYHVYEPAWYGLGGAGARESVAGAVAKAKVILSVDCDFLGMEDEGVANKRAFAAGRRVEKPGDEMNRLYVVEPAFTVTGAAADHRLRIPASWAGDYLAMLEGELTGRAVAAASGVSIDAKWVKAVAADLKANAGRAVVVVGRRQPAEVRAIGARINIALKGPALYGGEEDAAGGLAGLRRRIEAGEVTTLVILGGNPVYGAPADLKVGELIKKVKTSIRLGVYEDETSECCTWHIPAAHYLESWGDARSGDLVSPIQPMIEPLFDGKTALELLARVVGYSTSDAYELVRESFAAMTGGTVDEARWRKYLNEGVMNVAVGAAKRGPVAEAGLRADRAVAGGKAIEVCFALSESVFDGRFGNNGWMQECPDPLTKLTWDNAAVMSPRTARELGVETGDVVAIGVNGQAIEIAAFVQPGTADGSITLALGYGRRRGGMLASGTGVDVGVLRKGDGLGFVVGAKVSKTGATYRLATTQEHWSVAEHHLGDEAQRERAIIREASLEHFREHPEFAKHMGVHSPPNVDIDPGPVGAGPHKWGMVIDLTTCVGCTACTVACQAENNIPIVGKNEVLKGREMHWMRLDRYFTGADAEGDVEASIQPMLCQHCENAPCEPVCPVNATVHSGEGLNEMVYNRCIGTRYCANNCPYKVRRFNYFDFNKGTLRESRDGLDGVTTPRPTKGFTLPQLAQPAMQELLKMQKNPQVTVRMRGVMEKCTFCVQRIEESKIEARLVVGQNAIKVEAGSGVNRANGEVDGKAAVKVADGAVRTACQQACPTEAISFGDLSDPKSKVRAMHESSRNYEVLGHLNVRPRTTYLARLRNVNVELEPAAKHEGGHA